MTWRQRAVTAVLLLCTLPMASCWDRIEMNELSIVSMVGLDRNEDGIYSIYLQVINPASGVSAQGAPGGEQSPVYTYKASGTSLAETQVSFYKILPRRTFIHHAKVVLISGRAARKGIRDFMNFSELQPDARTSIPLLVADGSIGEVMRTFTPLDRNPGDSIMARLKLLNEYALRTGRRIEIRDVIERSERGEMIVIPIVAATPKTGELNSWDVNAAIDANKNQLRINGGAVIRNYRMVGRLNENELVLYYLLTGEKGNFVRNYMLDGRQVTASMRNRRAKYKLSLEDGKPVVRIRLQLEFSTIAMKKYHPETLEAIRTLEQHLSRAIADELTAFVDMTRGKGWDLLRIGSLIRRKAPGLPDPDKAAGDAEIRIEVESRLTGMGNLSRLYDGKGGKP